VCLSALSTSQLVSDPHLVGLEPDPTNNLLLMEGDLHKRARRLVAPYFAPGRLERLRGRLETLATDLVRGVRERPEADLVTDLAEPLVLDGIFSAMEVASARRARLSQLAREMLGWLEPDLPPESRLRVHNAALRATALFTRDRLDGKAVGLHAILEAAAQAGTIPEKVARSTPVVVLHGGYENPLHHLGCLIVWAAADPERFAAAAEAAPAVLCDEILRVFSPVRRLARWTTSDSIEKVTSSARKGEMVWIDLESAHNDRQRFDSPDVDVSKQQRHLGFGYGRHGCPGTALARLEGAVLIQSLLTIPAEELAQFTGQWREGVVAHGPAKIVRHATTDGS